MLNHYKYVGKIDPPFVCLLITVYHFKALYQVTFFIELRPDGFHFNFVKGIDRK